MYASLAVPNSDLGDRLDALAQRRIHVNAHRLVTDSSTIEAQDLARTSLAKPPCLADLRQDRFATNATYHFF